MDAERAVRQWAVQIGFAQTHRAVDGAPTRPLQVQVADVDAVVGSSLLVVVRRLEMLVPPRRHHLHDGGVVAHGVHGRPHAPRVRLC
eukprot:582672-Prorocentrum_minimum.AAC.1